MEGPREIWDKEAGQNGTLANCYGVTKDPTSNYMFVMKYYDNHDLYSYLIKINKFLSFKNIVEMLWDITGGLEHLHGNKLIHGNIHWGNILINEIVINNDIELVEARIADVGMHGPVDKKNSNESCRVHPFIAPEILKGLTPTIASDIYSLGMIMWALSAGFRPWGNWIHDHNLATKICSGLHPEITEGIPNVYITLMKQCLDPDPSKRPTVLQLIDTLEIWNQVYSD
ncbi:17965_t:CDS:2 [Funneliformis geosporum]|uniref:17965_t:CDS:1 n=1 Tax=Funneliformis geosporum TaxID=1117311 RepID=A0A9W4SBX4_9GLOM|nr:17965_t:CDS:2 [Funneliformis geosporum]